MTDQDRKDLQEFRVLYAALSEGGKAKTNNELFNAMLNGCKHLRKVLDAPAVFPEEADP